MNTIRKGIFITRPGLPTTIKCTQNTNMLPWVFELLDYDIPADATARIFVKKPSGKEVYNNASISGNEVTVDVTTQMVIESGRSRAQLQIVKNSKILNSFVFVVDVEHAVVTDTAIESSDEYNVLDGLVDDARKSASEAEKYLEEVKEIRDSIDEEVVLTAQREIRDKYIPEIQGYVKESENSRDAAAQSETNAEASAEAAADSQTAAKTSETNAKKSADDAAASAARASEIAGGDVVTHSEFPELDTQGVNLFGDYNRLKDKTTNITLDDNMRGFHFSATPGIHRINGMNFDGIVGYYTISGEISATKEIDVSVDVCDGNINTIHVTKEFKNFVYSFNVTKYVDNDAHDHGFVDFTIGETGNEDVIVYVEDFKLERGAVTHPIWTPAPEDIAAHTDVEQAVTGENLTSVDDRFALNVADNLVTDIPDDDVPSKKCFSFETRTASTASGVYKIYHNLPTNKTYTVSLYMKANKNLQVDFLITGGGDLYVDVSTNWKKYTRTVTIADPIELTIQLHGLGTQATIYVSSIKIEEGADPNIFYTPSPRDQLFHALNPIPEAHRNIFRGKNLGTAFTDAQKAAIKAGTFDDIWVGDYWTINSHTWRVVDINYWYGKGNTNCTTPHIVVMPDANLYTHKMNETNVTDTGYQGSLMYTEGLEQAKTIVNTDFGETYVLKHKEILTNAVTSGHASAGVWTDSTVELPNEIMMYGCHIFAALGDGTFVPYAYTIGASQLALFRLVPRFINANRQGFWLRDVVSPTRFAYVYSGGNAGYSNASDVGGVRPVVGITGGAVAADEPDNDLEVTELSGKGGEAL